jgi:hypothetical protein
MMLIHRLLTLLTVATAVSHVKAGRDLSLPTPPSEDVVTDNGDAAGKLPSSSYTLPEYGKYYF